MKEEKNSCGYHIATVILAYINEDISEEQQQELDVWLQASEENRLLFGRICDEKMQGEEIRKILSFNTGKAWVAVKWKVERRRQRRMLNYFKVAASIVLLVGTVSLIRLQIHQRSGDPITETAVIAPGHSQAKITFASGKTFVLDTLSDIELDFAVIEEEGRKVRFNEPADDSCFVTIRLAPRYNKIEIPKGGEYKIVLMDGTVVYLNSQTEFRFPENFKNMKERVVYLSGEAFFDVAKNPEQPFVVKCGDYSVRALGTSFNISNYEEDEMERTTLAAGKVEISFADRQILLAPGQQAQIKGNAAEIKQVEVENYTTWMNENFRFQSENIDEILKRIARWYAVDIFYKNPSVKNYHFSGYLPRYAEISEVLDLLSMTTDVEFEVNGRTVVVKKVERK